MPGVPASAPAPAPTLAFTDQPLSDVLPALRRRLQESGTVSFSVPDPDLGTGLYAGEPLPAAGGQAAGRHRSWAVWAEVAEALGAHLLTPQRLPGGRVCITLRRRAAAAQFGQEYGPGSEFARIDKLEDPSFLLGLVEALRRVDVPQRGRVLALGVGTGRELDALALAFPGRTLDVLGLDRDAGALAAAAQRHPAARFVQLDINALAGPQPPALGQFDLALALSVLQSPGVALDPVLRALHRRSLTPGGGLVLGFPNARYEGGELSYGARLRNFARPDLSLLFADVAQVRRYLHKHGFKVFVTGKHEVLVTAIPAGARTPQELEL